MGVLWVVALGSGTSGGILAPLLMIGAGLGCVLGPWLPGGDVRLWALVCMAATLGGTMRAPLMAVVFAFELTWDTNALLPTILGCVRSEEHTSELQSLMRNSYAVFCLKKKKIRTTRQYYDISKNKQRKKYQSITMFTK